MLRIHVRAPADARRRAETILGRPRPTVRQKSFIETIEQLERARDLTPVGRAELLSVLGVRSAGDVQFLRTLIEEAGSVAYAESVALRFANEASEAMSSAQRWLAASHHRDFLFDLLSYVRIRDY